MKTELQWGFETHDGGIIVFYTRWYDMPFFPRKGDVFIIDECSPVRCWYSEWNVDESHAIVALERLALSNHDSPQDNHRMFLSKGWNYFYYDGHQAEMPEFIRQDYPEG